MIFFVSDNFMAFLLKKTGMTEEEIMSEINSNHEDEEIVFCIEVSEDLRKLLFSFLGNIKEPELVEEVKTFLEKTKKKKLKQKRKTINNLKKTEYYEPKKN